MEPDDFDLDSADPIAVAGLLTLLLEGRPAASRAQACARVRPGLDERDLARVMAAIAPAPV